MRINTNISSITAQRNLERITKALGRSLERLSSGKRINAARDDASGLAVSIGLRSQATGLARTIQNMNEAFGYLNAADGVLQTQVDLVQRMRELAIQSANGTLTSSDRTMIQGELDQLMEEFNRLSTSSSFNGVKLLDGTFEGVDLQVGVQKGNSIEMNLDSSIAADIFTEEVTTSTRQFKSQPGNISVGGLTSYNLMLDLNGDGADDLIEYNSGGDFATTYLNDGTGSFSLTHTMTAAGAMYGVGDFNEDGYDDVFFDNGSSRVVKLSNGQGGYSQTVTSNLGLSSTGVYKIADFNNDGHLDVLSAGSTGVAALNLGTGTGGFSSAQTVSVSPSMIDAIEVLDLNNDDYLDLVISSGTSRSLRMGSGSGAFTVGTTLSNVSSATNEKNIADLNGDGYLDFVYLNSSNFSTVAFGTATGSSITATSFSSAIAGHTNVNVGDLDGDGDLDPLFSSSSGSATRYLNNGGALGTWSRSAFSLGTNASIVGLEDFNRDGIDDIISADVSASLFQLRGSSTGTFTAVATLSWVEVGAQMEDLDKDGYLDVFGVDASTGTLFTAWNNSGVLSGSASSLGVGIYSYGTTLSDLNGDGFKDFFLNDQSFGVVQTYIQGTVTNTESAAVDLETQSAAEDALQVLDNALQNLNGRRASIGALQNRLESAVNANSLTQENLLGAYSQVLDADLAQETAELVRAQIQQQASTSVLGQANVSLRMALDLIRV